MASCNDLDVLGILETTVADASSVVGVRWPSEGGDVLSDRDGRLNLTIKEKLSP